MLIQLCYNIYNIKVKIYIKYTIGSILIKMCYENLKSYCQIFISSYLLEIKQYTSIYNNFC